MLPDRSRVAVLLSWVLLTVLTLLVPRLAAAEPGFTEQCDRALPKQQIDDLIARMSEVHAKGECRLDGIETRAFRTWIRWSTPSSSPHEILLAPKHCLIDPTHVGAALAYHVTEELSEACTEAIEALREFTGEPREELAVLPSGSASAPIDPLWVAGVAWVSLLALGLVMVWQRRRALEPEPDARAWWLLGVASFVLALGPRFAVEPTITNWYGPFLPIDGWGELRFGTASALLHAAVRALLPWTTTTAFALQRIVGALAVPLVVVIVRRLGGSLVHAGIAAILVAFAPVAVRVSASSSEHVLAATLALAAWAVWLRCAADPSWISRLCCLTLVTLAASTRVDCLPQLAVLPVWTVFARPIDPSMRWLPLRRRVLDAGIFTLAWIVIALYGWFAIAMPANHPPPNPAGIVNTARVLLPQFWFAVAEPPGWLTPTSVLLACAGLLACAWSRRLELLLPIAITLALIFVPLGRNLTHDGLTGARYFVLLPALLGLVGGLAALPFEAWMARLELVRRRALLIAAAIALSVIEVGSARRAYAHEYTFQAEYRLLAEALAGRELAGCQLWFVRPQQHTGESDLDCCLSPARSPLTLVAPDLKFSPVPHQSESDSDPSDFDDASGCHLYYVGSVCALDPALSADQAPKGVERIASQCEALRQQIRGEPLIDINVTEWTLAPRFDGPPHLQLFERRD